MLRNHAGGLLQLFLSKGVARIERFLTLPFSEAKELPGVRTGREQSIITLIILSKNAQEKAESQACPDPPAGIRKTCSHPTGQELEPGELGGRGLQMSLGGEHSALVLRGSGQAS